MNSSNKRCLTSLLVGAIQLLSHVQLFSNPMDCSPPGSSVYGISQARILEYHFLSQARILVPFSSPEDLLDPGIEPLSPALKVNFFTTEPSGKP